ncbi:hypothetical protein D3C81_988320 [compost metagenome]
MHQDATTDQEHRRGSGHRQELHQPRRRHQQAAADCRQRRALARQVQAQVIQLDDAGDQPIDEHGHRQRDHHQGADLVDERRRGDHTQRQHDDFGREDEVGADRALHLVLLPRDHVHLRIGQRLAPLGLVFGVLVG